MTLAYLPHSEPPSDAKAVVANPGIRDTSLISLPALGKHDARGAALLAARSHYPGDIAEALVGASGHATAAGSSSFLHIIPLRELGEYRPTQPLFAPQDFLAFVKERDCLCFFATPGWIEWSQVDNGLPSRYGLHEAEDPQEALRFILEEAAKRPSSPVIIWLPKADRKAFLEAAARAKVDNEPFRIRDYESVSPQALSLGLNSFGNKGARGRIFARSIIAILVIANLALISGLLARDLATKSRYYESLRHERTARLKDAAELAHLKQMVGDRNTADSRAANPIDAYSMLQIIASGLPAETRLTTVDLSWPVFRIAGSAPNAYALVAALSKIDRVATVSLDQATAAATADTTLFTISGSFKHDK